MPQLLHEVLPKLRLHKATLDELTSSGATLSFFVGWFSETSNSRDIIGWELLAQLAELKISLDLDLYGPEEVGKESCENDGI